jgi:hypothetical protein
VSPIYGVCTNDFRRAELDLFDSLSRHHNAAAFSTTVSRLSYRQDLISLFGLLEGQGPRILSPLKCPGGLFKASRVSHN